MKDRTVQSPITRRGSESRGHKFALFGCWTILSTALFLPTSQPAFCQDANPAPPPGTSSESLPASGASTSDATTSVTPTQRREKTQPERDLAVEGLLSYGNYKLLASGENCKLYLTGVEYDRNSWGRALRGRLDYVGEVYPIILLNQPTQMTIWGGTLGTSRKTVPGIGFAPIGVRWLWRDEKAIKPYVTAKGGFLLFSQKALSSKATYENISLQSAAGVQVKVNDRYDLRLGLLGDFHFSDGFIVAVNPGLDVMNATFGVVYHLGSGRGKIH